MFDPNEVIGMKVVAKETTVEFILYRGRMGDYPISYKASRFWARAIARKILEGKISP